MISCATRRDVAGSSVIQDNIAIIESPLPPARQTQKTPIETVLELIKTGQAQIEKFLQAGTANLAAEGVKDVRQIEITGKTIYGGNEYIIYYDILNAEKTGEGLYLIPFILEDPQNGLSLQDELFWSPGDDEAGLLLSLDDNYFENWLEYLELFDAYQAKLTFFTMGIIVLEDDGSLTPESAIIADFCTEALLRGHGIGYHSVNHADLRRYSASAFYDETIGGAESFTDAGIAFSAFAYPYGFWSDWMNEILTHVFPVTRGYGANLRFYNPQSLNSGLIISTAIDNTLYRDEELFEDEIHLMLLIAKFYGNAVIPLTSHVIDDNAQWGITPKRLEYLLKTASELKLRFFTYGDLAP